MVMLPIEKIYAQFCSSHNDNPTCYRAEDDTDQRVKMDSQKSWIAMLS